ncbi:hypothetical protein JJV70_11795 [Streptomyces sp. JJ66]|uniref:DUF6571 family protein n=1 Tax=Streptomyces sp. JJ66 TaxID=2803843 RepID=UPI001C570828|nr:DUF6571 family protein [Streptomyces sp. JJ66]MBW1602779.1 hypothetical protein [Streptomyces sp. JJ66]
MDFDALMFTSLSSLNTAVGDWSEMIDKLDSIATDAQDGLQNKAAKANWRGVNATVTREFVDKTTGEFHDAVTQAKSIYNILNDTKEEIEGYRKEVNDALDVAAREKNLTAVSTGDGSFMIIMNRHPDRATTDLPESSPEDMENLKLQIQGIIDKATESDTSAAEALTALVEATPYGFSSSYYGDRDEVAQALDDAERLAKLGEQHPEDLSAKEFDEMNELMRKHRYDSLFAERFATVLGPEATLQLWAGLLDPTVEINNERGDQYLRFQENFSLTLANATHSDSPAMNKWEQDMVNLGDKKVIFSGGNAYGFQIMSNLMRYGDYDDQFLGIYGEKLMETEKEMSGNGSRTAHWDQYAPGTPQTLNSTGTDQGIDPMTGFMKALSNNPDAATEFFGKEFLSKEENHDFKIGGNGPDKDDKRSLSNFDYLFEERGWIAESTAEGKESTENYNALGEALEAATTGHPVGAPPNALHTPEQAALMEDIVQSISEDPARITDRSVMSDNMGRMAGEYMPDITRALIGEDRGNSDDLYPVAGAEAEMEGRDVTRFLFSVAQDPEGYAAVELGQKAYAYNLLDYHLNPNVQADVRYDGTPQDIVEEISYWSGDVAGILAEGRREAMVGPAKESDDSFNNALAQGKTWASGISGTLVGVGASFIGTPALGAAAGGGASTITNVVLGEVFAAAEQRTVGEATRDAGAMMEETKDENRINMQDAAARAAENHAPDITSRVSDWIRQESNDGFSNGSQLVRNYADDIVTTGK